MGLVRRRVLATLVVAPLLLGVGACGTDDDDGASGDTAGGDEFCEARSEMGAALGDLVDPTDSTSIDESIDQVDDAYDDLREVAGDDLGDEVDALGDAIGSLDDAVTASDGESVADRLETLADSVSAVGSALEDLARAAARDC